MHITHTGHLQHPQGDTDELTPPPLPTYTALRFVRGAHMCSNIRCGLLTPSQPSLALGSLLSLASWEASAVTALPLPTGSLQPLHHQTLGAEAGCLPALTASLAWNPLTPLGTRWSPQPPPAVWKGRREEAAEDKQDQQRSDSAQGEPTAREPSPVPGLQKPGQGIHTPTHVGSQGSQRQGQLLSPTLVTGPGQVSPPGLC